MEKYGYEFTEEDKQVLEDQVEGLEDIVQAEDPKNQKKAGDDVLTDE